MLIKWLSFENDAGDWQSFFNFFNVLIYTQKRPTGSNKLISRCEHNIVSRQLHKMLVYTFLKWFKNDSFF